MKLFGTVENIVYRNSDNNYTVLDLDSDGVLHTVVGKFPELHAGLYLELDGDFMMNTKYGEQFVASGVIVSQPQNLDAIEKYLASGLIRGVGEVTAHKIVTKFKQDTLDIMQYNPMRLAEIRGISRQKAQEIASSFSEVKMMQSSLIFLQSHNISTNMALKIFDQYKQHTIDIVKANPYRLVEDIDGIGFLTADRIALKIGIDSHSDFRVKAGIVYTLKEASKKEGHTYLPADILVKNTTKLLGFGDEDTALIDKILHMVEIEGSIKVYTYAGQEIAVTTKYYYREQYNAKKLTQLAQNIFQVDTDYTGELAHYEKINNIALNDQQRSAVISALTYGVSVITGGPGTGKTTIIKAVIDILSNQKKDILLLAPTGRASKRLSESCGREAKTVHRALEMSHGVGENVFNRNEHNPLNADLVIVDEMSMVDVNLLYFLLKAVKPSCRLVLVGDKDQLPSVDAGNVLKDIIESGCVHVNCLTQIYRQDSDSLIITNAHAINKGQMPVIDNSSKDFYFIQNDSPVSASDEIVDLVSFRLPNYLHLPSEKIQVLAPLKAGPCGVENLNTKLQFILNPPLGNASMQDDSIKFRVGDKVMQTSNNYDLHFTKRTDIGVVEEGDGVYNGDIGYIKHINTNTTEVTVQFEDGRVCVYTKPDLVQLSLAYAITIHKSQGSEFDAVVIPIVAGAPIIMTRNLLYTAITRAKKSVVLIGTKQNLARMIHNNFTAKRFTLLGQFLKDCGKAYM